MSSCPGYTLEAFLMWNYDLIVGGDRSANMSRQIAEAIGTAVARRRELSPEQFAPIVILFEPYRERVERALGGYSEEESGSWRDFAGFAFDFIPKQLYQRGAKLLAATPA